jgi:coenzyme F420-reducing hydrogenase beta subunit
MHTSPRTWQERENSPDFDWSAWERRIVEMTRYLENADRSVLDCGSGNMFLKKVLKDGVKYYPVDYKKRFDETIVCDFNRKEFPDIDVDVIFLSGILEYINDPKWFLAESADRAKKIVLSYNPLDILPDIALRRSAAWVNDLSKDEIITILHSLGFLLTHWDNIPIPNTRCQLFCFVKATSESLHRNYFCTGCGSCTNICPADALALQADEDGYYRPVLDKSFCTNCGQCVKACPVINPLANTNNQPVCFEFIAKDEDLLFKSSSGGAFPLLADEILQSGGIVAGAAWREDFTVEHILVDNKDDLPKLQKSKYLQSHIGDIYRQIKRKLEAGQRILFSGTPCQVAGLHKYLGKEYAHLYSIDLLCHYVPSTKFFVKYLEDEFGKRNVKSYSFRHKMQGWNADCLTLTLTLTDSTVLVRRFNDDPYQQVFHNRTMIPSFCEHCRFAKIPRYGDISLGDFHYIDQNDTELSSAYKRGISAVLINTEKGKKIFDGIIPHAQLIKKAPIEWLNGNLGYLRGQEIYSHPNRERFYALVRYMPFQKAVRYVLQNKYDIGLVGLGHHNNYGTHLTAYALYQILCDKGFEVLTINQPTTSTVWPPNAQPILFKKNPYRSFDIGRIYAHKTEMRELNKFCDMFMVGSDQLFNGYINYATDNFTFLEWAEDRKKKVAFATSFGNNYINHEKYEFGINFIDPEKYEYSYFLSKFDYLGLREKSSVGFVKNTLGLDAVWVLDPVFLLDSSYWDAMAGEGSTSRGSIFSYILDENDETKNICEFFSQIFNEKISTISDFNKIQDLDKTPFAEDWLAQIKNSKFVITDSFHGMCFSIIFKRPFIILKNDRGMSRIETILETTGLMDRWCFSISDVKNLRDRLFNIDWNIVHAKLAKEKRRSLDELDIAVAPLESPKTASTWDVVFPHLGNIYGRLHNLQPLIEQQQIQLDRQKEEIESEKTRVENLSVSLGRQKEEIESESVRIRDLFSLLDKQKKEMEVEKDINRKNIMELECRILSSRSWRIGRSITWFPRKVYGFFRCVRQNGLWYSIKLFFKRIQRKIGAK